MKKQAKKIIKAPLEIIKEFSQEAKKQIKTQALVPEETLTTGSQVSQKYVQKVKKKEEDELKEVRMEKAKILGEWRQEYQKIQQEQLRAAKEREEKEEGKERTEELEKREKEEGKQVPSGEGAIDATGASQKRPTGIWGVGGRLKKKFKWTAERKGKAPK